MYLYMFNNDALRQESEVRVAAGHEVDGETNYKGFTKAEHDPRVRENWRKFYFQAFVQGPDSAITMVPQ